MPAKPKTVSFDGARQCFVCETLEADKLTLPIHPAGPAVCTKCAELTPMDVAIMTDKAKQKRAAMIVGAPILLGLLSPFLKGILRGRTRQKRRGSPAA